MQVRFTLWFSPTCASWIWLSLGKTLRGIVTWSHQFHGDCSIISAVTGNPMAELIGEVPLPYAACPGGRRSRRPLNLSSRTPRQPDPESRETFRPLPLPRGSSTSFAALLWFPSVFMTQNSFWNQNCVWFRASGLCVTWRRKEEPELLCSKVAFIYETYVKEHLGILQENMGAQARNDAFNLNHHHHFFLWPGAWQRKVHNSRPDWINYPGLASWHYWVEYGPAPCQR